MVRHGGSTSYLANPTSPIPSHCASIVGTSTLKELRDFLQGGNLQYLALHLKVYLCKKGKKRGGGGGGGCTMASLSNANECP